MSEKSSYQRFDSIDRLHHILLFTCVFMLVFTGFPLRYYDIPFWRWIYSILGGPDVGRVLHRIFGILLIAVFISHVIRSIRRVIRARLHNSLRDEFDHRVTIFPNVKDFKDVFQNLLYLIGLQKAPPKFGKFSYKEKFDYWAVWWGTILMGLTGFIMLFPTAAGSILPGQIIPLSTIVHSYEALLDILVIIIWHFYNVHAHPRYFPMSRVWLDGRITYTEMLEEHPLELEKILEQEQKKGGSDD